MCVGSVKVKRLELSVPNTVYKYSMAGHRHALTVRSKGQRSRSEGYEMCFGGGMHVDMTA